MRARVINQACIVFLLLFGMMLTGCTVQPPTDVSEWKLATSAGSLGKLTQQDMTELGELGFEYIEVGLPYAQTDEDFTVVNANAKTLRQYADNAGVKIWSVHIPYGPLYDPSTVDEVKRKHAVERVDKLLAACEPLGLQKGVLHASFEPVGDDERAARLAACKRSLPTITAQAAMRDVKITVECLPRSCLGNTSTDLLDIIDGIDGIEICCDTNHLLQETTQDFIRKVGPHITTVHIADYDAKDERHWLPGKGVIDWNEVIAALSETGYNGPFLFECKGSPQEKVQCFEQLKQAYSQYESTGK